MNSEDRPDGLVGPERILGTTRSTMVVMYPAQHRLATSPEWEATCLIDSADPRDADWSPEWDLVSTMLHSLPAAASRVSICFEKRSP